MDFAAFACTAFPAHSLFAISANKLSGKYVIIYFFFATGRDFVFLVDSIHLQPQLVCNNRRKDVAVFRSLMFDNPYITSVVQDDVNVLVIDMFAAFSAHVSRFQVIRNAYRSISLRVFSENLAHDFGFRLVYDVLFVFDDISVGREPSRGVAFQPTFFQSAVDFLFQVFGKIFVKSLDDGKKELPFGSVRDVFHSRHKLHSVIREFLSVHDGFVLVAGKSIELVNDNHTPLPAFAVLEHLLKCRTIVVRSRCGSVDVTVHHEQSVLFRILLAHADLSFYGLFCLAVA